MYESKQLITIDLSNQGLESCHWEDQSHDLIKSILSEGSYYYTMTDTLGCTYQDSIEVLEVSIPSTNLGSDTVLCLLNGLKLDHLDLRFNNYLWSTGDTTSNIEVFYPGEYSLTISNDCGEDTDYIVVSDQNCDIDIHFCNIIATNSKAEGNRFFK